MTWSLWQADSIRLAWPSHLGGSEAQVHSSNHQKRPLQKPQQLANQKGLPHEYHHSKEYRPIPTNVSSEQPTARHIPGRPSGTGQNPPERRGSNALDVPQEDQRPMHQTLDQAPTIELYDPVPQRLGR